MTPRASLVTCGLLLAGVVAPASAPAKQILDVNVLNAPNVTVINKASNPLAVGDVQNPAFQPFAVDRLITVPNGTHVQATTLPPVGNDTQRAVIEHVTVDARVPLGQNIVVRIGQTGEVEHSLVLTSQGIWGSTHRYLASQPIRLYSVGGGVGVISFIVERGSDADSVTVNVTLSGHLVDLP